MDRDKQELLYRQLRKIRTVEEAIVAHYPEQEMRCPVHLCIGQEAVAAGACCATNQDDYVLSGHRSHGHYLAKGGDLNSMISEIYGKANGCSGGKGGSMHLIDLDVGFLGAVPIVGSTIPMAVGAAMSSRMRGENRISLVFLGEGATETGVFYESINFASVKNLPIIFVVENNLYSVYSPLSVRQSGDDRIVNIAKAHGLDASRLDGNDVELVYEHVLQAAKKARNGDGATLLEFMTYRWREHCGPNFDNDIGYRSDEEYLQWRERCPVERYTRKLIGDGMFTGDELSQIDAELNDAVVRAFHHAKESPWPEMKELQEHVYAEAAGDT